MNKRLIGNICLVLGALIAVASLYWYFDAVNAQKELLSKFAEVDSVETPVLTDGSLEARETVQLPIDEKKASQREVYDNGEMILEIPKLKVTAAVVKGTTRELLKKGPGLYEASPLPDAEGANVCIAGHRSTYGAWFRNVNKLEAGDEILLKYRGVSYTYVVEKVFIVDKKDWSVTNKQEYAALTLTSCHPVGSAAQRIIVRGKLKQ